jgi:hypothetical protein
MAAAAYSTVGTVLGFCRAIDSNIHGRIHVLVGTAHEHGRGALRRARSAVLGAPLQHRSHVGELERQRGLNPDDGTW